MSSGAAITVAIIDDNRLVREALASLLNELADLCVVTSAVANTTFLTETKPDVWLLDVSLEDQESLEVAAALLSENRAAKIIVMDIIPVHEDIMEFVNAGVSGFVLKDSTFEDFVAAIRAVAAGEKVLPPRMTQSLF